MDDLDHLNDRPQCGLCTRPVRWSDDFCSRCRVVLPAPREDVALEAELLALVAS